MDSKSHFDLVAIGSGPGGQKAAIQAAKLGKRVAVVDINPYVGGVCLHDGTIPSKSFREAIIHLSGYRARGRYGQGYRVKQSIEIQDLTIWSEGIVGEIEQTLRHQLLRNDVEIICGFGAFVNAREIEVEYKNQLQRISADNFVIATGTRPYHPPDFEIDNKIILNSNGILALDELPHSITIVGGGVIGCEYASMFAALGLKVTLIEAKSSLLSFVDREISDSFAHCLRDCRATILLNDKVVKCGKTEDGRAATYLESGKRVVSDVLLVSAGRVGNVERLNLESVGIKADGRGKISVDEFCQTSSPGIYAVGDVIGYPSLASTSIEQGRRAACHAFNVDNFSQDIPQPFGIYSIPEIAMVGMTEAELAGAKVPYETGIGRFVDVEKGKISGDSLGLLKLLFNRKNRALLGVHIIGEGATELIHIGQAILATHGTIDYFVNAVFNYPTLSQSYKIAALDGLNKLIDTKSLVD